VIDLDAFERNLRRLPERIAGTGVRARPHAKTHKCPVIALKQVALGAVGVCVQKVSEAEAMVQGGVPDVLVTNEVVGRQKLRRLAALAHIARVGVWADDPSQIRALDEAAGEAGVTLPVYVEVNMGGNRCGVEPGEPPASEPSACDTIKRCLRCAGWADVRDRRQRRSDHSAIQGVTTSNNSIRWPTDLSFLWEGVESSQ
jgi:D-serine deaminase-like pyridoxal phosphate-dependent protein